MAKRFESHHRSFDETDLFYQVWSPTPRARGLVIITHGLGEHSECYHPLARALSDDGWMVWAWDLRGHGRSEGKRGYARHVDDFVADLKGLHTLAREQHPDLDPVLFGHSLGGLITLRALQTYALKVSAQVLSAPALGILVDVPAWKSTAAKFANSWWPQLTLYNEVRNEDLSLRNRQSSPRQDLAGHFFEYARGLCPCPR
jgi:alpha-beta hydrolase superfamily lysophospholipase